MLQNFPNPFNPATTIRFTLKQKALVKFEFYDVRGRQVLNAIEENFYAGKNQIRISATTLPSGIYFYRMTVLQEGRAVFTKIKKMVLLK
ncbi:MAG: T9SS type A sorting domain-containing protein [Caldisericaceae bacterium]|nr:T9SS type A sorting domain-containing protein [Caldisericaceae bacterium]